MRERTAAEVAGLVGGRVIGDPARPVGPDVVIDSRLSSPGALFVALAGERTDGHAFIGAAAQRGAAAALVSHPVDEALTQIVVADPAQGLADLARGLVAEAKPAGLVCLGITGSAGKTSTKDLIAQVLAVAGSTVAPEGSFNNEIGVPLTATRIDSGTRYLVSEMGARGIGHIAWLCAIVPPDVGVVINVGSAHLGEFGSVAAIAQAKGELVEAVPPGGWAVLNADDPRVAAMAERTRAHVALFSITGEPAPADLRVWAEAIRADDRQRYAFDLVAGGSVTGRAPVSLMVIGAHQVANALAAAAAALTQGLEVATVAAALSAATPRSRWRMEIQERADGVLVINDAYNANPDSMRAALTALAGLRRPGGRLVAVLGDMLELGEESAAAHRDLGVLAARSGVDDLVAVGAFAADILAGAAEHGVTGVRAADAAEAADLAAGRVSPADAVLVKASRGLALESVAERLLGADPGDQEGGRR